MSEAVTYRFEALQTQRDALDRYVALLSSVYPQDQKFTHDYLDWLYAKNPLGTARGFDAFVGEQCVAHYACIPVDLRLQGRLARGLLSLNTATSSEHRGRGLFPKLARFTFEHAKREGFEFVYGVANAASFPIFSGALGFQSLGPLLARLSVGSEPLAWHKVHESAQLVRHWEQDQLTWRLRSPANGLFIVKVDPYLQIRSKRPADWCQAYAPYPLDAEGISNGPRDGAGSALGLFLGRVPSTIALQALGVDIPMRFRPSPLQLIFLSFTLNGSFIDPSQVGLSFIDFDAY